MFGGFIHYIDHNSLFIYISKYLQCNSVEGKWLVFTKFLFRIYGLLLKPFYSTVYCISFFKVELPGQPLKFWFKHQLLSFTPLDWFSFPFKYHCIPHTELLSFSLLSLFYCILSVLLISVMYSGSHVFMADGFTSVLAMVGQKQAKNTVVVG